MTEHDSATRASTEAFSSGGGLLLDAAQRGVRYRGAVADRRVSPEAGAIADLATLDGPLPGRGRAADTIIDELDRVGSPATVTMSGGRYFGFVIGGSLPVTVASNWLATAWDQNCALHVMSPAAATFEADGARVGSSRRCGLPADSAGAFVIGATMANFTALAAARHAVLARAGWDVDERRPRRGAAAHRGGRRRSALHGAQGARPARPGSHESDLTLPVDDAGTHRARATCRALDGPAIVCLQAGNVNTGAFDPAPALRAGAHEHGGWVHVDGAFGLWARACPARAALAEGFDLADSWATDAHKWLNVAVRLRHRDRP